MNKNLGNAWIANLKSDTNYWVQYNNVALHEEDGKKLRGYYDVKVVFNNPKGAISNAYGKDIAIFDGQLGAVRFRGYKHLDCSIYLYKTGTTHLVTGNEGKMHLRFIDIDNNQAVEVLTPGRVNWAYKKNKLSWMGNTKCEKIGATYENTIWFNGDHNVKDDWIQSGQTSSEYKEAVRYTFAVGLTPPADSPTTLKLRYYAGGLDREGGIGTQRNGAFFSFDGNLDLPEEDDANLSIDKVSDKYNHKVGDTWDYTIKVKNVTATAVTAKDVKITDSVDSRLKVNSVSTSQGTASHDGNAVTVNAGDLAQNNTVTVKVNVTALEASNGQQIYNKAKAESGNSEDIGKFFFLRISKCHSLFFFLANLHTKYFSPEL